MTPRILRALLIVATITLASCALAAPPVKPHDKVAVKTTAYTHTESDHIKYGRQAAAGTTLKAEQHYNSAAADWSFLPVGTKFRISGDDTLYVIDDYGSALVGTKTIDIYRPSRGSMNQWGTKQVEIAVVSVGDFKQSLVVLQSTRQLPYITQMINKLIHL